MSRKTLATLAMLASTATLVIGCGVTSTHRPGRNPRVYPKARKDPVVEVYHGVEVADPYRWLEDADSAATQAWVARQNALTEEFLSGIPARAQIASRLKELINYPRYSSPSKHGERYFFWKNSGLQNQSVLYAQETLDSEPHIVINPNTLSTNGTIAVSTTAVSWNGKLLAYGLSRSGSDEQEVRIRNVDTGREYDETLQWCRFTTIAWAHDGRGFFYSRFPDPNTVTTEDRMNYNRLGPPNPMTS